ncbi:hypothetical protein B0T16DRAFT_430742 [Cercophora newfieldiana]|uniref:Uncharacterized protein n=1 Tax=Cercophora newfieldiana TaxID=92897 RepID=A0AA39XUZ6_9PEZI|nr:hypothetical protein B0T16DRAFT_430742 [Cercophora newfieldiana]
MRACVSAHSHAHAHPSTKIPKRLRLSQPPPSSRSHAHSRPSASPPSLEQLPNELLVPIAAGLVPVAPLTTRFALRPAGTWELRDASHQWADWLACHNALVAFAQTSQRMAAIARPLLFHTLVIRDAAALVTLALRMQHRPEIRPWIRELTCLANITGVNTIDDLHREWNRQIGVKWATSHHVGSDATIGLALLENVVMNAPNLRDLLIAFPDHELPSPDSESTSLDLLDPGIRDSLLRYVTSDPSAGRDEMPFASYFSFLESSKVESLRVYCHREELDRGLSFSRILADSAVANLASFTNLKTLELCCSAFGRYTNTDMLLPPLPHVENLRLYGSYLHEPRLVAICLACVNLQTLLVHFERSTTDEDRDFLPEGKTLSDALLGLAPTLRSLELVALPEGHYLTRGRERPRKPENHRLTCIPHLTKLESLTLDYRGVFGTLGIFEDDDGERLCQLLPPLLRDFTLVCEFGTAKDWKQIYLSNLDVILYGVECLCTTGAPRLSTLSLAIHSWPAKSRFHRRFNRELDEARRRCARAGIKFKTIDLLPCYQDEDEVEPAEEDEYEDEEGAEEDLDGGEAEDGEELELEEEDEASEYYFSGDDEFDPEREARRPKSFEEFLERLGEDHGHGMDELFYAYHEDRWDEYLF